MPRIRIELEFDNFSCNHTLRVSKCGESSEFFLGCIFDHDLFTGEYYANRDASFYVAENCSCSIEFCERMIHPEYVQECEGVCSVCYEEEYCDNCKEWQNEAMAFRGMEGREFKRYCTKCNDEILSQGHTGGATQFEPRTRWNWAFCGGSKFRLPTTHKFGPIIDSPSKDSLISSLENVQPVQCKTDGYYHQMIEDPQAAYIIRAMGDIGEKEFVEPLISFLDIEKNDPLAYEKFPNNHGREIVHALAKIGGNTALSYLESLFNQPKFYWKHTVKHALRKYNSTN
jgi:hypothetical protein